MISELEDLLPSFSKVNHTRCFLHVNNLVARTLVKQFDAPKRTAGQTNEDDEAVIELAGDMELEDRATRERLLEECMDASVEQDDDVNGWIDEMAALPEAEREVVQNTTRPVKVVLVKVSMRSDIKKRVLSDIRFANWHSK
jgi:hypothetical protein